MPFDGTETPLARRLTLIEALQSPMNDWEWDYRRSEQPCGTAGCAVGYAYRLWPELRQIVHGEMRHKTLSEAVAPFFGLTVAQAFSAFISGGGKLARDVSPNDVATILAKF